MRYAISLNGKRYATNDPEEALVAMASGPGVEATIMLAKTLPGLPRKLYNLGNGGFIQAPDMTAMELEIN